MPGQPPSAAPQPRPFPVWQVPDPQRRLCDQPYVRLLRADHLPQLSPPSLGQFFLFLVIVACPSALLVDLEQPVMMGFSFEQLTTNGGFWEGLCVYSGELVTGY